MEMCRDNPGKSFGQHCILVKGHKGLHSNSHGSNWADPWQCP